MKGLLVRVGADQTEAGGHWNGPCDTKTGQFVYVPILEGYPVRPGFTHFFDELEKPLVDFDSSLLARFKGRPMHLDPDFSHLTYGDQGQRAKQISDKLIKGDLLVFYASLKDVRSSHHLIYALIGLYVIDAIVLAITIPQTEWGSNAHTRRVLTREDDDIVVRGKPGMSGRVARFVEIGEFRNRAYRAKQSLLKAWGGLSVKDGYLQRSARLPEFCDASRFYDWYDSLKVPLVASNN